MGQRGFRTFWVALFGQRPEGFSLNEGHLDVNVDRQERLRVVSGD